MPTYDYKCTVCDKRFEISQSIHDDSLPKIEECCLNEDGYTPLKKVFGAVGIAFKGSGFYRNDARGTTSSASSASSSSTSSSASSTTSSTSETKAASPKPEKSSATKVSTDNSAA